MKLHGKVPLPSTSAADCVTPLELPAMPSISGSVASRFRVTCRLLVATAPSLICTVPLGGVASMRVSALTSRLATVLQVAVTWQAMMRTR